MPPQARTTTPQHQLAPYLKALRRRRLLIALVTLAAIGVALALSLSQSKQYTASAQLFLNQSNPVQNIVTQTAGQQIANPERDLNSRVALITTREVADAVRSDLHLRMSAGDLLGKVSASLDGNSDIVTISAQDHSPKLAAGIANAFATAYVRIRQQVARQTILQAVSLAQRQLAQLPAPRRNGSEGTQLAQRIQQLQIAAALQTGNVEIASRADVPTAPSSPKPALSGIVAAILGLVVAIALAVGLEFVDRRVKDEEDLDAFGRALLAGIPAPRHPGAPDPSDFELREAYLTLATNLRFFNLGRDVELLLITSPSPRDGKTTVTLGCAAALAGIGLRVIVLECDLRRPRIASYTGSQVSGGLSTVLAGVSRFEQELIDIDAESWQPMATDADHGTPYFSVLPAGPIPPNPQGLLSSAAMAETVTRARAISDVVLLDTAPVGSVNDAVALAELVNGIVLLTRLNQTRRDDVQRSLRTLDNLATPILGFVATNWPRGASSYYGYEERALAMPPTSPVA